MRNLVKHCGNMIDFISELVILSGNVSAFREFMTITGATECKIPAMTKLQPNDLRWEPEFFEVLREYDANIQDKISSHKILVGLSAESGLTNQELVTSISSPTSLSKD